MPMTITTNQDLPAERGYNADCAAIAYRATAALAARASSALRTPGYARAVSIYANAYTAAYRAAYDDALKH